VRFDLDRLELKGPPVTLLEDVAASNYGGGQFDFSHNGTLVYLSGKAPEPQKRLEWIDAGGRTRPFFAALDYFGSPALSPDGKRFAVVVGSGGGDLLVYDLEREIPTKLPAARTVLGVIWASDGKHLLYGTAPGTNTGLMWIRADGSTEPQLVIKSDIEDPMVPYYLSPDGKLVVYSQLSSARAGPNSIANLWSLSIDNGDPEHPKAGERQPIGRSRMGGAAISRDGRWLAYSSGDTGLPEVFVRHFADEKITGEGMWQISAAGGAYPLWSKSRNQLLYLTPQGHVMVVDYTVDGQNFRPSKPRPWSDKPIGGISGVPGRTFFNAGFRPYDLTTDGRSIITAQADDQPGETKVNLHVTMLQNWFDELDRRLASAR
jgi:serine/threonine-protein kinase